MNYIIKLTFQGNNGTVITTENKENDINMIKNRDFDYINDFF